MLITVSCHVDSMSLSDSRLFKDVRWSRLCRLLVHSRGACKESIFCCYLKTCVGLKRTPFKDKRLYRSPLIQSRLHYLPLPSVKLQVVFRGRDLSAGVS